MTEGGGFLGRVVAATRRAVGAPDYLDGLPEEPARRPARWRDAVRADGGAPAVVAEFKRRSPGADVPELPGRSPRDFAARLAASPVRAYSCLAAIPEFGGSPADVRALAEATARPVLFKDFVIAPKQIEAAYRAGASAVLLIARLATLGLLDTPLPALARAAHARGLDVVLEWHDRAELRETADVPADVFAVNVRDLKSLAIRRDVAAETIRAAADRRPLVGLSGVDGPAEARAFWALGVDAIVVGSAVARAEDPAAFVRSLLPRPEGGTP